MTLIANTVNFSYPIIIGDILMSTGEVKKNTPLPTFLKGVDNLLPSTQKLFPYSLRQKIYVITDNLAAAFAGSEFQIKLFLQDLKQHFRIKPSSVANIEKFFDEYDFTEFDESAYLLLYTEKTDQGIIVRQKTRGPWMQDKSETFDHVFACGSGSEYYMHDIMKSVYHGSLSSNDNPLYRAISLNYIKLCNLLNIERLTLNTIREAWGAGFEMIYFDGERFNKMDDVTFIIWRGKVDLISGLYNVNPFLTLNFKYFGEILTVSATDFNTIEGYGVLPIDMKKEDVDMSTMPKKPNFKTKKICCSYALELSNGKIFTPAFFVESKEFPGTVNIDINDEGQIEVMIHKETEEFLIANLRQLIHDNKVK